MLKKITIVFLSGIFALISFELFLRYSPFKYGISPVEYNETIGYWHKKNFSDHVIKECYNTKYYFDKDGLPKNLYQYDSAKRDVIIIGDSYIDAIMVQSENIVHNSLAKEYNQKYNFLNYGLGGTTPIQHYIILKNIVDLSNVKYVIHFIGLEGDLKDAVIEKTNSFGRNLAYLEFENINKFKIVAPNKTLKDTLIDILGNFEIYLFIKKSIMYLKMNKKSKPLTELNVTNESDDLSKNWLYLKGSIYQTNRLLQSINNDILYKLIVVSDNPQNKDTLKKFLNQKNIDFVFLNDLAKYMNIELKGFKCDGHWNDKTHNNIAKMLYSIKFIE